jgi:hypothetical protein
MPAAAGDLPRLAASKCACAVPFAHFHFTVLMLRLFRCNCCCYDETTALVDLMDEEFLDALPEYFFEILEKSASTWVLSSEDDRERERERERARVECTEVDVVAGKESLRELTQRRVAAASKAAAAAAAASGGSKKAPFNWYGDVLR